VAYRFTKFARRNRVAVVTSALILLSLVAGIVATTWMAMVARRAEEDYRRVLAGLWEELTDRALDAAFSGDLQQAQDAIDKARTAGAPEDLLQTLDGLALFFSGDNAGAITKLENAVNENPNSLSALSALWWACGHAMHPDRMFEVESRIVRLASSPKSAYETLLLSLTQAIQGPPEEIAKVIERLDRLITSRRRWGVAYVVRASARMEYGMESRNIEDFRKAVADAQEAEDLLPGSSFVYTMGLYVLTTAFEFAEHQGSDADAALWRDRAEAVAAKLNNRPNESLGRTRVVNFLCSTKQLKRARDLEAELVQPSKTRSLGNRIPWLTSQFQERRADVEPTLKAELNHPESSASVAITQIGLAIVLAEKSPIDRVKAMQMFQELKKQDLPGPHLSIAMDIPLLLGNYDEVRNASRRLLQSSRLARQWRWFEYVVAFHAGEITEDDLIARAEPFSNARCMAHYAIAMKALAFDNREKARRHFEEAAATGQVGWWSYHWSQAYLQRMKEDPTWPAWIPATKEE
jgi:tetratricopeptide (TPR) repeat protein